MRAKTGARILAGGRLALGLGLLIAPRQLARGWVGDHSERESTQMLMRAIGARDAVIGLIALHTIDHPQVGPRWQRTTALLDAVDAAATLAARRDLPSGGVLGTTLIAGGASLAGALFSKKL